VTDMSSKYATNPTTYLNLSNIIKNQVKPLFNRKRTNSNVQDMRSMYYIINKINI